MADKRAGHRRLLGRVVRATLSRSLVLRTHARLTERFSPFGQSIVQIRCSRGLSVGDVNNDGFMEIAAVTTDSDRPDDQPTWLLSHTGARGVSQSPLTAVL